MHLVFKTEAAKYGKDEYEEVGMAVGQWHIENFNNYRLEWFYPSERFCVDDIFSRWYVLGVYFVNLGLSEYVKKDVKRGASFKIQDTCYVI